MSKTKYIVAIELSGDHGEDEGCEHVAIFDNKNKAEEYIKYSRAFKSMKIIEAPINPDNGPTQIAEMGITIRYNLLTKEANMYRPLLIALSDFEKPRCSLHNYFPIFETTVSVHIQEKDPLTKAIKILQDNQNELIKKIGDCYRKFIGGFIKDGLVTVVENYEDISISILFHNHPNDTIQAKCIISNYGIVAINEAYDAYKLDPSIESFETAIKVIQKAVIER
jgi:hypothetical protein